MKKWSVSLLKKTNENNNKADRSGLISMCKKAGRLKCGMDIVKSACENGEAKAVFVASDLSEKSVKEVRFNGAKNGVPVYRLSMSMEQIANAIGRKTGILAITDGGFAKSLKKSAEDISADIAQFYSEI